MCVYLVQWQITQSENESVMEASECNEWEICVLVCVLL